MASMIEVLTGLKAAFDIAKTAHDFGAPSGYEQKQFFEDFSRKLDEIANCRPEQARQKLQEIEEILRRIEHNTQINVDNLQKLAAEFENFRSFVVRTIEDERNRVKTEARFADDLFQTEQTLSSVRDPLARYVFARLSLDSLAQRGISGSAFQELPAKRVANDILREIRKPIDVADPLVRHSGERFLENMWRLLDISAVWNVYRERYARNSAKYDCLHDEWTKVGETNHSTGQKLLSRPNWRLFTATGFSIGIGLLLLGCLFVNWGLNDASSPKWLLLSLASALAAVCVLVETCRRNDLSLRYSLLRDRRRETQLRDRLIFIQSETRRLVADARSLAGLFLELMPASTQSTTEASTLHEQFEYILAAFQIEDKRWRRQHPEFNVIEFPTDREPIHSARMRIVALRAQMRENVLLRSRSLWLAA